MSLTNTHTRFGGITKFFHWSIALGIFLVIPLGVIAYDLPYDTADQLARKATLFSLHKTVGVTIFLLALARIIWALTQPKPASLHPERKLETLLADAVHWLLYGSLVLVPLTGWIHHAATTGFAPILWPFGQSLPFVAKNVALAETFAALHKIFERVMVVSLLLHIAGALKHHFVDKDDTLRRMLPGTTEAGAPNARQTVMAPLAVAVVAWVAALGIGAGLGLFQHDAQAARPALASVASDWTVEQGTLGLSINQFGSDVTGSFEDWTAAITFDETVTSGTAGSVDVTISIPSVTLGSVTAQALGADFFSAEVFPTATFAGPITVEDGAYTVEATLTLRGVDSPVSLPFDIVVTDETATVTGQTQLDRRVFGIGDTMTDESQLGFGVTVVIALTATR